MENKRTIVTAVYEVCSEFVVPEGIDLNSPDVDWWIKWDTMFIELKDGRRFEIEPRYRASDADWKRPDKTEESEQHIHPDEYAEENFVVEKK
jgi:hypothetical protein